MKIRWVSVALVLAVATAGQADVLNMGGSRSSNGTWTGLASLETVPVGDPGNAPDLRYETPGYGSVGYAYNIGKYEVTAGQYTEFLNKVAGVDTHYLYDPFMWSSSHGCKIECFAGAGTTENPYQYRVAADYANRPVNYVNFWDACRFANWLHNGQPVGSQGEGTTETGAYTLIPGETNTDTIVRNPDWKWAVTSEDEWYKAAYYDPRKAGGAGYWDYPTGTNTAPDNGNPEGDTGNSANYNDGTFTLGEPYYRTPAGYFGLSDSPLGTFDQGGNVWEWNEATEGSSFFFDRGIRGGSLHYSANEMQASYRSGTTGQGWAVGFRVVEVPEPVSMTLLVLGGLTLLRRRVKR